ncbi:MAG TPA: PilW family protein [Steroidobacteraceae bacterium]|nr:PilW family protein [Steroidobacteraceae bacterium]
MNGYRPRRWLAGFSLIELMVALVIGAILIAGAVTVYSRSRVTYRVNEMAARMQETARYAMDFIESDLRMASYWGLNSRPELVLNRASPVGQVPSEFSTATWATLCGTAYALNLDNFVEGLDDRPAGNGATNFGLTCNPQGNGNVAGSDVLIVRRASNDPVATIAANRVYLQTSRIQGVVFVPPSGCTDPTDTACIPAGYLPPLSQTHDLVVNAYYVAQQSIGDASQPALRRKALIAGPAIDDQEIIPGVEDLQLEFGVDANGDGSADYYVAGDDVPVGTGDPVISVRVWLRVRADAPDFSFTDGTTYTYAGRSFTPAGAAANFRRALFSKTIQLRNTRL